METTEATKNERIINETSANEARMDKAKSREMVSKNDEINLWFMRGMYRNKKLNTTIVGVSVVAFTLALIFVRAQTFIGDKAYMRAMIPHHSIAIMTSKRATIKDPEVRKLADGIIEAQVREIAEMQRLLEKPE